MKIKSDFITNSSSSSFVVAIKHGTTRDDLESLLAGEVYKWMDGQDSSTIDSVIEDLVLVEEEPSDAKKTQLVLEEIVRCMVNISNRPMTIGNWDVQAGECGNEGGDWFGEFLYSMTRVDTDKFKFEKFY